GPEAPLCNGLADLLDENNIPCFGPIGALAQLEGSKLHAKHIMRQVGVPTADFQILDASSDIDSALSLYQDNPWVIKRDVLAGGKGVVVTTDHDEAKNFISKAIESDGKVLLEEFLPGEEASMLVVMDGSDFVCLPPSQDHKRAYDGDEGPNTGGMGAYCPAPVVTESVHEKVIDRIVKPMFDYLSGLEIPYRGVLYVGLMITDTGEPNVVEFNVRFGDPECQITIPMIKTDLFEVLDKTARDKLSHVDVKFHQAHALTVVLASEGYPNNPIKGRKIRGLDFSIPTTNVGSSWVNFAGVGGGQETALASGGRVLSCSAMADTLNEAARLAYSLIDSIDLEGSFYRLDIGGKAL
ncbi:MAG: phosphoribosylamine--glycine ligase, partial [Candidatus Poseidoniaceae archaeon]|nr:phosphoribosylamine--glycine ligase [Candidatus Poseidoniaceae archaeon]